MKKLIAILTIMIVLVGAVFAADGDQLVVTAKVDKHIPSFKIFGGTSASALNVEGTATGATIATNTDISLTDITVYFKLTQNSITDTYTTAKAKYKGVATLTVDAEPLSATVSGTQYATADPACNNATVLSVNGISSVEDYPATSAGQVVFKLSYDGRSIDDTDVATFNFKWTHLDSLPPAETYSATVALTIETT